MEDVIFNGNADSGPLGMAEVSLLLERDESDFARAAEEAGDDEAHSGLPPELARASEILVTRRYFRSGDSEYYINRAACRLKDITELFLGTGVGSKAYAIVEQGRVDQLVNAKPEDMRSFIEEAAGTTRFRSRKLAAERKMTRTRENLLRVQDVLREIERQMTLLDEVGVCQNRGPLDHVLQLTDIPRPWIAFQEVHGVLAHRPLRRAIPLVELVEECLDE